MFLLCLFLHYLYQFSFGSECSRQVQINGDILSECSPQVQINDGILRGKFMTTKGGRRFSAFLGIPYAKPPIGNLRFKPPEAVKPWNGILNATKIHAVCPQRDVYRRSKVIEGDEDCLYLNVYTPQASEYSHDPLPVMIFFHGGGWICGGGNSLWYGPDILLDRDVVLVVTNYRLGALGFLTTGDEIVPGNNGLKDQVMALKWVNNNIFKFGGNPDKVTLFGESAGGASAHFHMMSPLSTGLFQSIIAQSGTALCTWAVAGKGEGVSNSKKLAKLFDCPTESSMEMVECLRKINATLIIGQDTEFMEWDYDPMIPFKPVIEPKVEGAFMTEHPVEMIESGKSADVPMIIGLNTEDGGLKAAGMFENAHTIEEFDENFNKLAPLSLMYSKIVNDTNSVTKKLKEFYFSNEKLDKSKIYDLIHLYTDGWFLYCADAAIRLHLRHTKQPIYYYLFGHRGASSFTKIFGGGETDLGVCHADELQYLFPIGDGLFPDKEPSDDDKMIAELLTTLWVNFAETGNPTPQLSNLINEMWKPVQSDDMEYYYIGTKSAEMQTGLLLERAKLWRSFTTHHKLKQIKDEL
uniref:Carboxylic ester hydrolase n=1 Tax=Anoplophora glabripennis TaxID=217634 RepID=A0A8F8QQU3_ANOGL|nr:carboxylesterase [Anoplophora glabripennis]QYA71999.1 carboxylesterase [Anoplophora glabripennis]